jgi:hypothetical protein
VFKNQDNLVEDFAKLISEEYFGGGDKIQIEKEKFIERCREMFIKEKFRIWNPEDIRSRFIKYIEERANKRQSVLELVKN